MNVPSFAPHLLELMLAEKPRHRQFKAAYMEALRRREATMSMHDYSGELDRKFLRRMIFVTRYLTQSNPLRK